MKTTKTTTTQPTLPDTARFTSDDATGDMAYETISHTLAIDILLSQGFIDPATELHSEETGLGQRDTYPLGELFDWLGY